MPRATPHGAAAAPRGGRGEPAARLLVIVAASLAGGCRPLAVPAILPGHPGLVEAETGPIPTAPVVLEVSRADRRATSRPSTMLHRDMPMSGHAGHESMSDQVHENMPRSEEAGENNAAHQH